MNKEQWHKANKGLDIVLLQPEHTINKPSHLIKQLLSNSLTTNQKKLYNLLIRKLLDNKKDILEINRITIKRKEINQFLKISKYQELEQDLARLQRTVITVEDEKYSTRSVLISSFSMPKDLFDKEADGLNIIVRFDTKLTETFREIKSYANLHIYELQALKNTHSISLYEIFKKQLNHHNTAAKINFTEVELKQFLNIDTKQYKRSIDFHNYVIKKAINEINSNTLLDINYKRIKIKKGEYQYNFIFSQYIELTLNNFTQILKKLAYYKSIIFSLDNVNYTFEKVFKDKTLKNEDQHILLINYDIANKKDLGEKQNYFNNSETLPKEDSEIIYKKLYDIFLVQKSICFIYQFFILKDFTPDKIIKSIGDIEEEYWDFTQEYSQHFTK